MSSPKRPTASRSYFTDVKFDNPTNPTRIVLVRAHRPPPLPQTARQLVDKIQEVTHVIRTVFAEDNNLRKKFFGGLHLAAAAGLRGADARVEDGLSNLDSLKTEIAESFYSVRNRYRSEYFRYVRFSLVFLLLGGAIYAIYALADLELWFIPDRNPKLDVPLFWAIALFWVPFGVAVGVCMEFIYNVRKEISFDDLIKLNPARWKPLERLSNTVFIGYVFAAAMGFGLFQIGVGSLLLNDFVKTNPLLSILVGFVAGFASPYVLDIIGQIRPTVRNGAQAKA